MTFSWKHIRSLPSVLEASAWLTVAWLALDVLPGRLYRRLLPAAAASNEASNEKAERSGARGGQAGRIGWAVERASRAMPFRSVCFHRGIAAHRMLRLRGIPSNLHYGVARATDSRALRAHVWVSSEGRDVVGGLVKEQFQEIAHFPFENIRGLGPDGES